MSKKKINACVALIYRIFKWCGRGSQPGHGRDAWARYHAEAGDKKCLLVIEFHDLEKRQVSIAKCMKLGGCNVQKIIMHVGVIIGVVLGFVFGPDIIRWLIMLRY